MLPPGDNALVPSHGIHYTSSVPQKLLHGLSRNLLNPPLPHSSHVWRQPNSQATHSHSIPNTKCFVSIHRATFFFFCVVENQFQSAVVYRIVSHFKIYRSCMNISGDFQWTVVTDLSKCRISCLLRHDNRVFLAIILTLATEKKKKKKFHSPAQFLRVR